MARAILHIGTPKTGTTFLQRTFAANRKPLSREAIVYPALGKWSSHTPLALAFNTANSDRHQVWGVTDRDATQRELATVFSKAKKSASNAASTDTWVLSTESAARLDDSQARNLYDFLTRFFDDVTVLVYLRRREFMLASRYSQRLKDGGRNLTWKRAIRQLETHEPNRLINRWSAIAGSQAVVARPYFEYFKSDSGALLADFCAQVGISPEALTAPPENESAAVRNASLSAEGVEFLRSINPIFPAKTRTGKPNSALRLDVVDRIQQLTPGDSLVVPPRILRLAHQKFSESDRELVSTLAGPSESSQWQEWLAQSPSQDAPARPTLSARRACELMAALSVPEGPVDFAAPDWRPSRARDTLKANLSKLRR